MTFVLSFAQEQLLKATYRLYRDGQKVYNPFKIGSGHNQTSVNKLVGYGLLARVETDLPYSSIFLTDKGLAECQRLFDEQFAAEETTMKKLIEEHMPGAAGVKQFVPTLDGYEVKFASGLSLQWTPAFHYMSLPDQLKSAAEAERLAIDLQDAVRCINSLQKKYHAQPNE